MMAFYAPLLEDARQAQRRQGLRPLMATKGKAACVAAGGGGRGVLETLQRFGALADGLRKGELDSQRKLERAAETLTEVAGCEEELQAHAQALMSALGAARDTQQAQADAIRDARAGDPGAHRTVRRV